MIFNIFALLPFALFAAAQSQCDTGVIECCNKDTMYSQTEPNLTELGLVDVAAVVDAFVALSCSGINVVGTSDGYMVNQGPLCCENEKYVSTKPTRLRFNQCTLSRMVPSCSIGCTPINVGL
ncbi:hypothetical protein BDR05DRAFT_343882 [Suillus weaverae]|nr:hypothetical protein BDR05DRAFT_343882 [Suillus weaverae]